MRDELQSSSVLFVGMQILKLLRLSNPLKHFLEKLQNFYKILRGKSHNRQKNFRIFVSINNTKMTQNYGIKINCESLRFCSDQKEKPEWKEKTFKMRIKSKFIFLCTKMLISAEESEYRPCPSETEILWNLDFICGKVRT